MYAHQSTAKALKVIWSCKWKQTVTKCCLCSEDVWNRVKQLSDDQRSSKLNVYANEWMGRWRGRAGVYLHLHVIPLIPAFCKACKCLKLAPVNTHLCIYIQSDHLWFLCWLRCNIKVMLAGTERDLLFDRLDTDPSVVSVYLVTILFCTFNCLCSILLHVYICTVLYCILHQIPICLIVLSTAFTSFLFLHLNCTI